MVARFDGEEWRAQGPQLSFALPRHNQSKIKLNFPADTKMSAPRKERAKGRGIGPARIDAIMVYTDALPPERDVDITLEIAWGGSDATTPTAQ